MKLLAINFLKNGDLIQSLALLQEWKKNHPNSKITLVIYKQFEALPKLASDIDQIIAIDREEIIFQIRDQKETKGLEALLSNCQDIFKYEWDIAVNLSHDKVGTALMSAVQAKKKIGVHFDKNGRAKADQIEARYLNEIFTSMTTVPMTKEQAFASMMDTPVGEVVRWNNKAKVQKLDKNVVGVFPFSSEAKKNISLENLRTLVLKLKESNLNPIIFCTEDESKTLDNSLPNIVCNVEELIGYLSQIKLVIAVDTLGAHLALSVGAKALLISLGSSNPFRQRILSEKAVFVQSKLPCSPCPHGGECTQSQHLCGLQFNYEKLAMICREMFLDMPIQPYKFVGLNQNIAGQMYFYWLMRSPKEQTENVLSHYFTISFIKEQKNSQYPWFDLIEEEKRCEEIISKLVTVPKQINRDHAILIKSKIKQIKADLCSFANRKEMTSNEFKSVMTSIRNIMEEVKKIKSFYTVAALALNEVDYVSKNANSISEFTAQTLKVLASISNALERTSIIEHKHLLKAANSQEVSLG